MLLLLTLACKSPEAAPDDLDGLFHWFWSGYFDGDDATIAAGIDALVPIVDQLEELPYTGTISDLTSGEIAGLSFEGDTPDPTLAQGMFMVGEFPCTTEQLDRILTWPEQMEIHDTYETYQRTYLTDLDAYRSREVPTVEWETTYTASLSIYGTYQEWVRSGARYVTLPDGAAVMSPTWMYKPSVFDNPERTFEQDYQMELYWERTPGTILHVYGIWRWMNLGENLTSNDEFVIKVTLNELEKWDEATADVCAADGP